MLRSPKRRRTGRTERRPNGVSPQSAAPRQSSRSPNSSSSEDDVTVHWHRRMQHLTSSGYPYFTKQRHRRNFTRWDCSDAVPRRQTRHSLGTSLGDGCGVRQGWAGKLKDYSPEGRQAHRSVQTKAGSASFNPPSSNELLGRESKPGVGAWVRRSRALDHL
jgi:hypothetical protein